MSEVKDLLPIIVAGDQCPKCQGNIEVTGETTFFRVPIYRDGAAWDEAADNDGFNFIGEPYCGDCGQKFDVVWPEDLETGPDDDELEVFPVRTEEDKVRVLRALMGEDHLEEGKDE